MDINSKIISNFWDIGHTMHRISEGKGSQKRILIIINENRGITQSELTRILGIQPGSVSEVLSKFEAAGLIERTPSPTDRRTTDIQLTPEGMAKAEDAANKRSQRHQHMFLCLSDDEKAALLSLLEKVNSDWKQRYCGDNSAAEKSDGNKN